MSTETEQALRAWNQAALEADAARTAHYGVTHEDEVEARVTFDIYVAAVEHEREVYQNFLTTERREKSNG